MNCRKTLSDFNQEEKSETIDVIWCCENPPDIVESVFSYEYCLKTTRQLCKSDLNKFGFKLVSWHEPVSCNQILRYFDDGRLSSDYLMIVTNPELVVSPEAVIRMVKGFEGCAGAVLPVFNETSNSEQAAHLPGIYLNLSTYLEISGLMPDENLPVLPGGSIDCSCVLIRRKFVENFISFIDTKESSECIEPPSLSITPVTTGEVSFQEILASFVYSLVSDNLCVIQTTALVHSFGMYYGGKRPDLVELVPDSAKKILDVGCANGGFGELMKARCHDVHLTGVEMNNLMAGNASCHYAHVYNKRIEDIRFETTFDHINCGDIIEHLYEPWKMIGIFYNLLKKDGSLVVSLPNAGHWTIVKDLAAGKFEYLPVGLLCLTHIRWFTEKSIKDALYDAGFEIEIFNREQIPPTPAGEAFIRVICENGIGDCTSLLTNQFTIRAWKR